MNAGGLCLLHYAIAGIFKEFSDDRGTNGGDELLDCIFVGGFRDATQIIKMRRDVFLRNLIDHF